MARQQSFETQVAQLEEAMIAAMAQPGDVTLETTPPETVLHLLKASFPYAITESQGVVSVKAIEPDDKVAFRHSARILLDSLLKCALEAGVPLMQYVQPPGQAATVPRLLDTVLWLCSNETVEAGMVFALLEDLVDTATVSDCRELFTYIEDRLPILRTNNLVMGGKLTMLRCCNQLLRRLSKSNNAQLCGRISMLLAWLLPLWDKSGTNQQSNVNATYPLVIEDVQEGATDSNGAPVDVEFYRLFWGLQRYFQAPQSVLEVKPWETFCTDLGRVFEEFERQPLASGAADGGAGSVKYLTSSKLIHLQLQDPAFRRQFLIQCLILFHFVREPIVGKEKKAGLPAQHLAKADELEKKVMDHLAATPDCGMEFASAVKKLMERESSWVAWKASGAPAFDRPPAEPYVPPSGGPRKRARKQAPAVELGTEELDLLWNLTETNTSSLKAEDRENLKTCEELMLDIFEEMDPAEGIEESDKRKHEKVYKWKVLRMVARLNLQVFSDTIEKAEGDLEYAALKLFPGSIPAGVDKEALLQKFNKKAEGTVKAPAKAADKEREKADVKDEK